MADETWFDRLGRAVGDYAATSYQGLARGAKSAREATDPFQYAKPAAEVATSMLPGAGLVEGSQDFQRGREALSRGQYGQAAVDYITGAGNVGLEAIPGGALAGKAAPAILAGIGAWRAPRGKLKKAFEMERAGASADDIWKDAGWERGADTKWRFEIPDTDAAVNQFKLTDFNAGEPMVVQDLLSHPRLYEAYPNLATLPVSQLTDGIASGVYRGDDIGLKPRMSDDYTRKVLLHELQHGVQGAEGFAPGGNPEYSVGRYLSFLKEKLDRASPSEKAGILDELENALSRRDEIGNDAYKAIAGEVEARNVAERAGLHPDELREFRPALTEDGAYPRSKQIIPDYQGKRPRLPRGTVASGPVNAGEIPDAMAEYQSAKSEGGEIHMASGGAAKPEDFAEMERSGYHHAGLFPSSIPGRTDKLPATVAAGSYIVPADVVSALGEGNTLAGTEAIERQFGAHKPRFAAGGGVKIIAAGGEYAIPPEIVKKVGGGDMDKGHDILDRFVVNVRKKNIKTLSKLPGPAK